MARLTEEQQAHELRALADDITFNLSPLFLRFCASAYESGDMKRLKNLHGFIVRAIQKNDQPSEGYGGE